MTLMHLVFHSVFFLVAGMLFVVRVDDLSQLRLWTPRTSCSPRENRLAWSSSSSDGPPRGDPSRPATSTGAAEKVSPSPRNEHEAEEESPRGVAVCFAGLLRTFESVQEEWIRHAHYPDYDYFFSIERPISSELLARPAWAKHARHVSVVPTVAVTDLPAELDGRCPDWVDNPPLRTTTEQEGVLSEERERPSEPSPGVDPRGDRRVLRVPPERVDFSASSAARLATASGTSTRRTTSTSSVPRETRRFPANHFFLYKYVARFPACHRAIEQAETARNARYKFVLRLRPDILVRKRIGHVEAILHTLGTRTVEGWERFVEALDHRRGGEQQAPRRPPRPPNYDVLLFDDQIAMARRQHMGALLLAPVEGYARCFSREQWEQACQFVSGKDAEIAFRTFHSERTGPGAEEGPRPPCAPMRLLSVVANVTLFNCGFVADGCEAAGLEKGSLAVCWGGKKVGEDGLVRCEKRSKAKKIGVGGEARKRPWRRRTRRV